MGKGKVSPIATYAQRPCTINIACIELYGNSTSLPLLSVKVVLKADTAHKKGKVILSTYDLNNGTLYLTRVCSKAKVSLN